jgi:hypothetical protein
MFLLRDSDGGLPDLNVNGPSLIFQEKMEIVLYAVQGGFYGDWGYWHGSGEKCFPFGGNGPAWDDSGEEAVITFSGRAEI